MERRIVQGGSIQNLVELLTGGGHDAEHSAIIDRVSEETAKRLNAVAGADKLAQEYVRDLWSAIFDALKEAEINTAKPKLPEVLRVMADVFEMREQLHKELHDKRLSEQEKVNPFHKDMN